MWDMEIRGQDILQVEDTQVDRRLPAFPARGPG